MFVSFLPNIQILNTPLQVENPNCFKGVMTWEFKFPMIFWHMRHISRTVSGVILCQITQILNISLAQFFFFLYIGVANLDQKWVIILIQLDLMSFENGWWGGSVSLWTGCGLAVNEVMRIMSRCCGLCFKCCSDSAHILYSWIRCSPISQPRARWYGLKKTPEFIHKKSD